jgi:hypothetical protein
MSLAKIEARVAAALKNKGVAWIFRDMPKEFRDDPRELREYLLAAAEGDPNLANTEPFRAAYGALHEVAQVRELRDKVAALYHNPKVQLAAGDKLDWYMAHPSAAYEALMSDPKLAVELGADLVQEVKLAALGARDFAAEHGIVEPAVAAKAIPTDPGKASSEYQDLIKKSVTGKLTDEETARLHALAGGQVERDAAVENAHVAAITAPASKPGEYDKLISKSVTPGQKLSASEETRLNELATSRAEAAGLLEQPEAQETGHEGQ